MSKKNQNYTNRKQNRFQPERMRGNVFVNNNGRQWRPGENGRAAKVERLLKGAKEERKEIAGNMAGYKYSGVKWIGAIPKEWNVNKLKYICHEYGKTSLMHPENDKYIGLENVISYSDVINPTDTEYAESIQKVCKKGTLLFSKLRPYLAKVVIAPFDGYCTNEFLEFDYFYGDMRFLKHCLRNPKFINEVDNTTYGVKMPRTNTGIVLNQYIPLPPLPEQQRIADFLDTKCGILDRTIDAVSRQIEDLEKYKKALITKTVTKGICKKGETERAMKDSGVEWIGEDVPFDWDINRLQFCIDEISERNYAGKETHILSLMKDKGVIPYEEKGRVGNISKTDLTQYKLAYPNTLITNSMNIIIGSSGVSQYKGCVSPAYYVFKAKPNNDIRYFNYIFAVRAFQNECRRFANGILEIRLRISSTNLLKIKVPVPPLAEQQQIADYLDEKCKNIDNRMQKRKQQLEWLKEYKKSLIFDYVTGKKRV